MDYLWVLIISMWQVLLMCIYHFSVITHEYYAHDRIHSWVFSYYSRAQKCTTGVTREYFQLVSYHSQAVYFSCRMIPTCDLFSNFLEARGITHIFCKLGRELYCISRVKTFKVGWFSFKKFFRDKIFTDSWKN